MRLFTILWKSQIYLIIAEEVPTIVIQQMPTLARKDRPTIAVITSNYYEKLAVDAMMENKTTYVKYQSASKCAHNVFFGDLMINT